MLTRLLLSALVAGLVAGAAVSVLQRVATTPLILTAETYEAAGASRLPTGAEIPLAQTDAAPHGAISGAPAVAFAAHGDAHGHGEGHASGGGPDEGLERLALTSLATIGTAFGFALILLGAMALSGAPITAHTGLAWGAAAFAATGLAPAVGLPPELPGSAAAALPARQLWWVCTALASAAGLWLVLRVSTASAIAAGLALLVAPHLVGAPRPEMLTSRVPGELAGEFAAASLAVQAITWALVGAVAGAVWDRTGRAHAAAGTA